ncbi:protease inhibitor I9 family protein [Actinokineospora soli]|uniref:Protease inhibitor I9 family protein n=1 Tax=Actinokineospora soli TaxID=1048753 RepID=A0ABW2TLC1_9PSEU
MRSRKRVLAGAVCGLVLATGGALALTPVAGAAEGAIVQAKRHYAPGMYIVVLEEGGAATASASAIEATSADLARRYGGELSSVYTATLHGFAVRDLSEKQAKRLAADPAVRTVYEDGTSAARTCRPTRPGAWTASTSGTGRWTASTSTTPRARA